MTSFSSWARKSKASSRRSPAPDETSSPASEDRVHYREVLEAIPVPVWVRGSENSIVWANKAFVSTAGFSSLEDALAADAMLQRSERDLAVKAL